MKIIATSHWAIVLRQWHCDSDPPAAEAPHHHPHLEMSFLIAIVAIEIVSYCIVLYPVDRSVLSSNVLNDIASCRTWRYCIVAASFPQTLLLPDFPSPPTTRLLSSVSCASSLAKDDNCNSSTLTMLTRQISGRDFTIFDNSWLR